MRRSSAVSTRCSASRERRPVFTARWIVVRATLQARAASLRVSLAIGRLLQVSVQEFPGLGVQQLDKDTPMTGLGQAPAAQDFPCEFRQSGQQRRLFKEILPILSQYRRPIAF